MLDFGFALRTVRLLRHLTQGEVATAVGVSTSHLSLLEDGKRDPSLALIQKLAEVLRVPVSVLIFIACPFDMTGMDIELVDRLKVFIFDLLTEKEEK